MLNENVKLPISVQLSWNFSRSLRFKTVIMYTVPYSFAVMTQDTHGTIGRVSGTVTSTYKLILRTILLHAVGDMLSETSVNS